MRETNPFQQQKSKFNTKMTEIKRNINNVVIVQTVEEQIDGEPK